VKRIHVAVFGHYDSRGGTMALEMDDFSEASLEAARRRYDRDVFGIGEDSDAITQTAYGTEARAADRIVHRLLYKDTTPGVADFLYVAELTLPLGLEDAQGELSYPYSESTDVLIEKVDSPGGNPDQPDENWKWGEGAVRLELVDATDLSFSDLMAEDDLDHEETLELMNAVHIPDNPYGGNIVRGFATDDVPAIIAIRAAYYKRHARREDRRHQRITARATVLDVPMTWEWGDDAYGFVLVRNGTGEER